MLLYVTLMLNCRFGFQKPLNAGVCSAYSLRGTKRRPEIVYSDLEQRCSYGPLLTRATETEGARSIDTETQGA